MEKPILENYEKQIDVDCFILTQSGIEQFEKDDYEYQKKQDDIQDCKYSFRLAIDKVVEEYKQLLEVKEVRDILEEVSNIVYEEL